MAQKYKRRVDSKRRMSLFGPAIEMGTDYSLLLSETSFTPLEGESESEGYNFLRIRPYQEQMSTNDVHNGENLLALYRSRKFKVDKQKRLALKVDEIEHSGITDRALLFVLGEGEMDIWSPKVYADFEEEGKRRQRMDSYRTETG